MLEPIRPQVTVKQKSNKGIFWIVGGVLVLCFGLFTSAVTIGLFWMNQSLTSTTRVTTATQRSPSIQQPVSYRPQAIVVATPEGGVDYETAVLKNLYEQVNLSVVNITALGNSPEELLGSMALPEGFDQDDYYPLSSGSGFIWDTDGHIITNNHVVEDVEEIQITFSDGTMSVAKVVGTDEDTDLAVLKIDPTGYNLVPVRRGTIDNLHVGNRVAAIGNPFGMQGTLTSGIVSAIGRSIPGRDRYSIPDAIQTDAAINPGNSGGPLLNETGEVIGVNAQIRSEVRANSGVGFAIPITIVERVVPSLIENGRYEHSFIGVSGNTYSPICAEDLGLAKELRGALIIEVLRGTPAARARLQGGDLDRPLDSLYPTICPRFAGGDLVTAVDSQPVTAFDDILTYLQSYTSPGDTITLTVLRADEFFDIDVTLSARP